MDAETIKEMNKARVKMGMRPLPVPGETETKEATPEREEEEDLGSTIESREAAAYDNWQKHEEEQKAKKRREEKNAAIKKAREVAQRNVALEGKGLGDLSDNEDQSAMSWIKNSNKRQKKIIKQRTLLDEAEAAQVAAASRKKYTADDLTGVTIAHDKSSFLDGDDHILTLKDTGVLDSDGEADELEAFSLRESEKLQDRLDLKKRKPGYNPNDVNETGEHSILAQYDEEISGKKRKNFTLGATSSAPDDLSDILQAPVQKRKFQTVDLGILDDAPTNTSDYLDPSEIKVKSKKKKKAKSSRKRAADDDDEALFTPDAAPETSMDLDLESVVYTKKKKALDDAFVDDDDLQTTLAQQRRDALKKRKKVRPEDIAKQLREQGSQSPEPDHGAGGADKGLLIDEITHFVGGLQKGGEDDESKRRPKARAENAVTTMDAESSDEDEDMKDVAEHREDPAEVEAEDPAGIGADEKLVGGGMAEALQLLKERGLVSGQNGSAINESYRQKQQFLAELHRRMADFDEDARVQRERDRATGRLDRMSAKEREDWQRSQNAQRDLHQTRIMDQLYRQGYKPNVDLKYIDEHGRRLDQKEAFKELSHGFHGKKSGKGKTEKLLKKIEDEKRRNAQSVLDASQNVGMSSAATLQGRKRREAGVRLA